MTTEQQPGIIHKRHINGGLMRSPAEWAELIKATIKDPHLAAWAASVISWDLYDRGLDMTPLDELSTVDLYETAQRARPTADLVAALESIGYNGAADRCQLKENEQSDRVKQQGRSVPRFMSAKHPNGQR